MKKDTFRINVILNIVIKLASALVPLILSPFVSRALLPSGLGSFSYAHSIVSYFCLVVSFGFVSYGTKTIANVRDDSIKVSHVFWNVTYAKLILLFLSSACYFLVINLFDLSNGIDRFVFLALYLSLLGSCFDTTFFFQGTEKMVGFSLLSLITNTLYMVLVILFVKKPTDLLLYTAFKSSIILVTSLLSFILIAKKIKHIPKFNFKTLLSVFFESLAFFIPSLIVVITPIIDQTMLGSISGTIESGYYEAANKVKTVAIVFASAISAILLSRVAFLHSKNESELAFSKISSSIKITFFVLLPIVFGAFCVSDLLFITYFGDDFAHSEIVMYFLAPDIIFSSISNILLFGYFYSSGKTKQATIIILVCDAINVFANIVFIRYFGAVGAAITSSVSNGILMLLCIIIAKKDIHFKENNRNLLKVGFSSVLMVISVITIKYVLLEFFHINKLITLILCISFGIITYVISCFSFEEEYTKNVIIKITHAMKRS